MTTALPAPLTERYRPHTLSGLVGQREAVARLRQFAESWGFPGHPPRLRAALLEGVPGTGKTAAAYALAEELGWGVVELGASDVRNHLTLEGVAGRASLSNGFSETGEYLDASKGRRTLILLDDADSMSSQGSPASSRRAAPSISWPDFLRGRYRSVEALNQAWGLVEGSSPPPYPSFPALPATGPRGNLAKRKEVLSDLEDWRNTARATDYSDRGGLATLAALVRESHQPILLTALDGRKLSRANPAFRTGVVRIRFLPLHDEVVRSHLNRVAASEHLRVSDEVVRLIARQVRGDLRAALTDLEVAAALPPQVPPEEVLGWRDVEGNLYDATSLFLGEPRFFRAVEVMERTSTSPDELLPWIEENLAAFAGSPEGVARGFHRLAQAQVLLGRAQRQRIWSQWGFASELMTGGVSVAIHSPHPSSLTRPRVEFPRFLGQMGSSRNRRGVRAALLGKVASSGHLSSRKAAEDVLPYLERVFTLPSPGAGAAGLTQGHRVQVGLARELRLGAPELALLLRVEEDHPSVQLLLREAEGSARAGDSRPPTPESGGPKGRRRQRTLF